MDTRSHCHLFTTSMLSESNGAAAAAAAYEAMGIGSSNHAYQGAGGSVQSDSMHGIATAGTAVPVKRKRGRPRKYVPSNIPAVPTTSGVKPSSGRAFPATNAAAAMMPEDAARRAWVRSPNSNKKHRMETLGQAGAQIKAHILSVLSGEEISTKILAFAQQAARRVTILSVTGKILNATLLQAASYGGTVTYEGPFEILTLSGSFLLSNDGQCSQKGSISVLLANQDGRVLGGNVAGPLVAASRVEVVLGIIHAEEEKQVQEEVDCIELMSPLGMPAPPFESMGQATHP